MYLLYTVLFLAAFVLSLPWWILQMLRTGKYRAGWRERFGKVPEWLLGRHASTIWIHAVSVGEVLAISRVAGELKRQLPDWRIVISTATDTGQTLARERFGERNVFYVPLDLPFAVRPFLRVLNPRMLLLAETEFWPNLLRWTKLSGAKVVVVNARVSDRSLPRYKRLRKPLSRVLHNLDLFLAQSEEDARRLVDIGAPAGRVRVSGNLKFEVKAAESSLLVTQLSAALREQQIGPVLVSGSTLEGEEVMMLETFRAVLSSHPAALMILAPRHPERFDNVAALLTSSGIPFQRRSRWNGGTLPAGSVFLLDSIGELSSLYQLADLAFVGGSLVPRGGHNVLEAAQYGVPILVGPHTENFREIVAKFQEADTLCVVSRESLTLVVLDLLKDERQRRELGQRTLQTMNSHQGATARTVDALLELLSAGPVSEPAEVAAERPV